MRISILIIIMTLTCSSASADKYSRAWKKVDALIKQDLPESAAEEINRIWDMAAGDNDGRQMLKSAVYLTRVQQTYGEESLTDGIELFKTLLPKLSVPEHKALCHAFLVEGYKKFRDNNSYLIEHNRETDNPNPPIQQWTRKMITDTICYHLDQSINLGGSVAAGYYEEFFPGGNKAGLKLRPELVDMLMDNADISVSSDKLIKSKRTILDDARLYGSALDFLAATREIGPADPDLWRFYVLHRLTQHNMTSKPSIRATIDMRRMSMLSMMLEANSYDWNQNYDAFVKGCTDMAEIYEKKVKFSTLFYSMAAGLMHRHINDFDKDPDKQISMRRLEHDICMRSQKKWPKSEGAINCLKIRAMMESPAISLSRDGDFTAGEHNIAMLSYSNIGTAYFKVVEVTGIIYDMTRPEMLAHLNGITPVSEWSMNLTGQKDWLEHYAIVDIPPVMQGCYYLMASSGPYFTENDFISYQYVECNNIGLAHMIAQNGALSGYAVNLKTGMPISCRYTVWQCDWRDNMTKVATQGFSNDDGFLSVDGLANGRYRIELSQGDNRGNCTFQVPWVSDIPDRGFVRVFTDRYTYLPGDSVWFTAVAYLSNGYENGRIMKNADLTAYFKDPNSREIERFKVTTDSMGVVHGMFHIPENIMPGRATVQIGENYNEFSNSRQINIESFRQPKFEIKLDNPDFAPVFDRPFQITGRAVTFTDVPVDGAHVSWNAGISSYSLHPFLIKDENDNVRISNGELETAQDGSFSIPVTVPGDIQMNDDCFLHISVSVTDHNGETHDRNLDIRVGGKSDINIEHRTFNDENGAVLDMQLKLSNGYERYINGTIHLKVTQISAEPLGLPLPFSLWGKRLTEIKKIVDDQHLRERFKRYDLYSMFAEEGDVPYTVCFEKDIEVTAQDGAQVRMDGLKSGLYLVNATSSDAYDYGDLVVVVTNDDNTYIPPTEYLWISEDMNHQPTAEVGDTVRLRVSSCLPGAVIYWFVENRFGMYDRGIVKTDGKQQTISIPVTDELKGMFAIELGMAYEGYTESKYITYQVQDRKKQLDMELVTFRDMLEPDSPEEWTVRVTDKQGNPVKAAVMMDMYDSALDKYGRHYLQFMPWSTVYVGTENLFKTVNRNIESYYPTNRFKIEYKGKKALTGTLMNPFEYYFGGFQALGITSVDEALQGKVAGLDIIFDSGQLGARSNMRLRGSSKVALNDPLPKVEIVAESVADVQQADNAPVLSSAVQVLNDPDKDEEAIGGLRTDMNPTGLFEYKVTDADGLATFSFKAPQLLTRWNLQAIAFTDSLKTGRLDETVITRKLLMVEPSAPRFLRQGDRMEFTFKVSNLTDKAVSAKVALSFTDAVTGQQVKIIAGQSTKTVSIPANGSIGTGFTVNVPAGLTAVTYRITAQTTGHSDGIQETIPVLSNRTRVVQSVSLFNNGNEKRSFVFSELKGQRSSTISDEQLVLEYSASPIWYAIQALPSLICVDEPSNLRLFYSYMGAAISDNLNRRYPAIRKMLDEWADLPPSAWQNQLERNQKLTGTLLEETPWLFNSLNENDRLRHLARSLGSDEIRQTLNDALERLQASQLSDGGWPWINGYPSPFSSIGVTDEIMNGLGQLLENGIIIKSTAINRMIKNGVDYIDAHYRNLYKSQYKPKELDWEILDYLMTRSYYQDIPFFANTKESYDYYISLIDKVDTHNLSLGFRTDLALLLARLGRTAEAEKIVLTILDRSLYSDEMGRYWRDNYGGVLGHERPVKIQSTIIRLLLATNHRQEAIESARWLLKQRQTTGWDSSPATASAVVALMATGADTQLESDPDITIYVGKEALQASTNKAISGYTTHTWDGPIGRDKADITIDSKSSGISWGGIFRIFNEEMDKVESSENGMTLKRTVWRVVQDNSGERLEEVKPGTILHVGDKLRIQFELSTDRNLEYVQLADMRAATMEPLTTRAGYVYNWSADLGFYSAPGNTRNVFYIDRLSKGAYRLEYNVNVQKPGRFQEGIAVIQCLYAPEFRATTTGATLTVE